MASEVTRFRELLYDWLTTDLPAFTGEVGDRIFPLRPPRAAATPCCTVALVHRRAQGPAGLPAWRGVVEIALYDASQDALDALEELLVRDVTMNADAMLARLSDADTVRTTLFAYVASEETARDAGGDDALGLFVRTLRFDCAFAKRPAAWT
jgi:hypothetical protein